MGLNASHKLIQSHLVDGEAKPGLEIALRIDQTLTQDATGTLVMLALEATDLDRVRTECSVQYVDHNLLQVDSKNADDHLFLHSACRRYGIWFSRPGNGVSHAVHMQCFGAPGKTMVGSDSHTPAAGALGMLAIGAGGLDVAMSMAGRPLVIRMPEILGVRLEGRLPDWVSAKDIILEMLRRHGVAGAVDRIIEYYGPGLSGLSTMDRHVIANMGTELGATSTVFPSDGEVKRYLESEGRGSDWAAIQGDEDADYDLHDSIDLGALEPLIAKPSSPGNVVSVGEVAGEEIYQAYIGSSANPGYRDFAVPAMMVAGRQIPSHVSFDINPTSRQLLLALQEAGHLTALLEAGARLHQAGCNGCIGMGQAPATNRNSLRTVPRNFPGRSGTIEDSVFLCSPETATASALAGRITDPRSMDRDYPHLSAPSRPMHNKSMFIKPVSPAAACKAKLVKGPNIDSLPNLDALPEDLTLRVLLKVGDDISTDEILPAGARALPYRSNIPKIAQFAFETIHESYPQEATKLEGCAGHAIVAGENYGQGSSREHAALAPRYLGLRLVIAKSFARIHAQNLINFGVLPATFDDPGDFELLEAGTTIELLGLRNTIDHDVTLSVRVDNSKSRFQLRTRLSPRNREILLAGGVVNWIKSQSSTKAEN
jgi:aconitate hydratase